MTYWDKIKSMNNLILFAKDWKSISDVKSKFKLTAAESWKLFRRVIKSYDEFEYRDVNNTKAGCPVKFRATEIAYNILKLEMKNKESNSLNN